MAPMVANLTFRAFERRRPILSGLHHVDALHCAGDFCALQVTWPPIE
jgi:hypothetical protein